MEKLFTCFIIVGLVFASLFGAIRENTPTETPKPYIIYQGEKYYFCFKTGSKQPDTLATPDGSLQIFISYRAVYNHFGCENIVKE